MRRASAAVVVDECHTQGIDRNSRYESGEEDPGKTNRNRQYARERLPRHDIAITNRQAGDESEIDRVTDRPALEKANEQAQGNLNPENDREDRPGDVNGAGKPYKKAPPHGLGCRPVHVCFQVFRPTACQNVDFSLRWSRRLIDLTSKRRTWLSCSTSSATVAPAVPWAQTLR